ncbi:MAG: dephospho-CoA kinase [Caldimicrobium sp.]|nr:dephospho-CoA kinase [Caldimicrobium sp.]MDW8183576.1 dephospho-CoA kinase [Caldimicrobium sp.]
MTKTIAITGGIASGKSTLLKILNELNFPVLSCDEVIREFYQDENIKEKLRRLIGEEFFSDKIHPDKTKILERLVKDETFKRKLEEFFHPLVLKKIQAFVEECRDKGEVLAFVEVPLLFEIGWEGYFDEIWVITCSEETQRKRLREKPTWELRLKLVEKQLPLSEKIKRAKVVLSSEITLEELKRRVKDILKDYLGDLSPQR